MDKVDDENKLAGLEALVPEELEKHLVLNSNRLRTLGDAGLEIVTYAEAKFRLRIRDSKPSDTGPRGHSDPLDVDAVESLSSGKAKGVSASARFPLQLSRRKMELTARRAGREVPKTPATTPVVGARFFMVVHRGWCRSTRLCFDVLSRTGHDTVGICVLLLFLFSVVFQFVRSIQIVGLPSFGSRKP